MRVSSGLLGKLLLSAAVLAASGAGLYALATGRLFLDCLPDCIANPVLGRLYLPCVKAQSEGDRHRAYGVLIDRLGVERLLRLHQRLYNEPFTAIALGRSGDAGSLAVLRAEAARSGWDARRWCAIHGLVSSGQVAVAELRDLYRSLPADKRWPFVYAVVVQGQGRLRCIVEEYTGNHSVPEHAKGLVEAFLAGTSEARGSVR